jgi:hypothetical protein
VKRQSQSLEIKIEQDKRTASRKLLTSASTQANAPKRTSAAASRVSMEKELEPQGLSEHGGGEEDSHEKGVVERSPQCICTGSKGKSGTRGSNKG